MGENMVNNSRRIYQLDQNLTPEQRIVTFAKCSRSAEPFDQIAKELTDEKAAKFNQRYVVAFGHLSVAEHAAFNIAMEDVSILATKVIEDNRLGSFTERSTRYQIYDKNRYYKPASIMNSKYADVYEKTGNKLFEIYEELYPIIAEDMKKTHPKTQDNEKTYDTMIKGKTCDVVRYILPVATLTSLGMTLNARNLIYAINKMLSHPLGEMQDIANELKSIAEKSIPTLSNMIKPITYLNETLPVLQNLADQIVFDQSNEKSVTLVSYDQDADDKLVTALIYKFSSQSYKSISEKVKKMSQSEKEQIIDEALKRRNAMEQPLRELEHINYTFDILMDYGAFRDIQRHRMCTQTNQLVTCDHGYEIPEKIKELKLEEKYIQAMDASRQAYETIKKDFPFEAQYIVAFAYKKRTLFTWNLRELHHFISLRSRPAGHISYRTIANQVFDELEKVHPLLAKYINVVKIK
jgi:thymidylate synthase ThyX